MHKLVVRGLQVIGTSKRKAKQLTSYRSISAIIGNRLAWRRRCFLQPQSGCGITVLPLDCMYTLTVSQFKFHNTICLHYISISVLIALCTYVDMNKVLKMCVFGRLMPRISTIRSSSARETVAQFTSKCFLASRSSAATIRKQCLRHLATIFPYRH